MTTEEYVSVRVPRKVLEEAGQLLKKGQEQGLLEWRDLKPGTPQQIIDAALFTFVQHLREDLEE